MKDPSLPLQKAVYDALRAALPEDVGLYDEIPLDPAGRITASFPFVSIGDDLIVSDADQCHDACEAYPTIHVWSRKPGRVEAKTIMATVCLALDVILNVVGFGVISHRVDFGPETRVEQDRLTKHGVVTFAYKMAPTA